MVLEAVVFKFAAKMVVANANLTADINLLDLATATHYAHGNILEASIPNDLVRKARLVIARRRALLILHLRSIFAPPLRIGKVEITL